jgi:hypothetical protein
MCIVSNVSRSMACAMAACADAYFPPAAIVPLLSSTNIIAAGSALAW